MGRAGILIVLAAIGHYASGTICDWSDTSKLVQNEWTKSLSFEFKNTMWSYEGLHFVGDAVLIDREPSDDSGDAKLIFNKVKRGKKLQEEYVIGQVQIFVWDKYCLVSDYNIPGIIGFVKVLSTHAVTKVGMDAIFPIARGEKSDAVISQFTKSTRGHKMTIDFSHLNEHQCHYGVQYGYRYIFSPSNAFIMAQADMPHFFPKTGTCNEDPERIFDNNSCKQFKNGAECSSVKQNWITKDVVYNGTTGADGEVPVFKPEKDTTSEAVESKLKNDLAKIDNAADNVPVVQEVQKLDESPDVDIEEIDLQDLEESAIGDDQFEKGTNVHKKKEKGRSKPVSKAELNELTKKKQAEVVVVPKIEPVAPPLAAAPASKPGSVVTAAPKAAPKTAPKAKVTNSGNKNNTYTIITVLVCLVLSANR